jgi:colicin import membrane protein
MADVNKSVEISYRADIKQLEKTLRAGGKLSEKQIKEMIGGLNKQLKQTEKAAKETAKTTQRSMQTIEHSAERAEHQLEELHGSAGDVGSVLSGIAGAIGLVNPELEGMAMAAADSVGGLEGLVGIGKFINPAFAAFAVLAAGAAYAVSEYTAEQERAAKAAEELKKEQDELNKKLQEYERIQADTISSLGDFTAELNMAQAEVLMLSGEIDKADFESMKRDIEANKIATRLKNTAQERVDALRGQEAIIERNVQLAKEELKNIIKNRTQFKSIKEEFQARAAQQEIIQKQEAKLERFASRRAALEHQINMDYDAQAAQLLDLRQQAKDLEKAAKEREKKLKDQNKAKGKQKKTNDELKAQEERLLELQRLIDDSGRTQEISVKSIEKIQAQRIGKEAEIALNYKLQAEAITESKSRLEAQLEAARQLAETEADRKKLKELEIETAETIAILEQEHHAQALQFNSEIDKLQEAAHKKRLDEAEKERQEQVKNAKGLASSVIDAGVAIAEFHAATNKEDIKAQQKLFKVNQAASVAKIAMSAAEAIAGALGLPPIIRGLTIAAITAGAAAQTGVVLAQTPPTADMGGMIGNRDRLRPDENMVRVLSGEAVLDRATVNRIGGEEGLQRLQAGGSTGNVVVVQPFKHFDRFIKQSNRTGVINRRNTVARY